MKLSLLTLFLHSKYDISVKHIKYARAEKIIIILEQKQCANFGAYINKFCPQGRGEFNSDRQ